MRSHFIIDLSCNSLPTSVGGIANRGVRLLTLAANKPCRLLTLSANGRMVR